MINLEDIPKQMVVTTGCNENVLKTLDLFLFNTSEYLKEKYGLDKRPESFKIMCGSYGDYLGAIPVNNIKTLIWKDRPIAGVLETRSDYNRLIYTCWREIRGVEEYLKQEDSTEL